MRGLRLIAALIVLPVFMVMGLFAGAWLVGVFYWTGELPTEKVKRTREALRASTANYQAKHRPGMN